MIDDLTYVPLLRKLTQWEWYNCSKTLHIFIHCLLKAQYSESSYQGYKVPAGSFVSGVNKLSIATGMTVKSVRVAIEHLKSTGEITTTGTNKFTIIKVIKWDTYKVANLPKGKQKANKGQTKGKQRATSKEGKKERKKEVNKARPENTQEVEEYAKTIDYFVDGQNFIDHYEANGWMRGKSKIKCWKSCLRTWKKNGYNQQQPQQPVNGSLQLMAPRGTL